MDVTRKYHSGEKRRLVERDKNTRGRKLALIQSVHGGSAVFRRRHALHIGKPAIEIGDVVEANLKADFRNRVIAMGQTLTGLVDPKRIDKLYESMALSLIHI